MEVIVEQLGTTNNVLERQKFDRHTVWLGRDYGNDVLLTDEHVDAVHAKLSFDEEGRLWIEDQGSVNGIRRPRHKQRIEREQVRSGDVFLIGRSRVRVITTDHPVPPAVPMRASEVFLLWLGKPQVAAALALVFVAARLLETWLTTIGEFRWGLLVEQHLGSTLMFLALAVGVYFLSVLFRRGGNFLAHVSLLILIFLVASLVDLALMVGVFNAGDNAYPMFAVLSDSEKYIKLFIYLWSIFYLAFHVPLLRRSIISFVIVLAVLGVDRITEDERLQFMPADSYPLEPVFLPQGLLLRAPSPAADFDADVEQLFGRIDESRREAVEERDRKR
ncbi:MAG: FHA domain-containing protein, partial [Wenzhouxiangellaceae bacterium]